MNQFQYTVLAYAVGLIVLWGYAASIWLGHHSAARRERRRHEGV
ncbi:MAG: hypothetical protein ACYC26_01950 [Phycisphaerales bacterium]